MKTPSASSTAFSLATRAARSPLFLGAIALALGACASGSSSSSSTPAAAPVAAMPAPATPVPAVSTPAPTPVVVAASIDFDKQVKPFFAEYCVRCHGGGTRVSGRVNLATKDGLTAAAGTPGKSRIFTAISAPIDGDGHMPLQGQPQPEADDIAMIKQWIGEGTKISADYSLAPAPAQ